MTLASIEPFDFPNFDGPGFFLASIDIIDLLDEGTPFNVGQSPPCCPAVVAKPSVAPAKQNGW